MLYKNIHSEYKSFHSLMGKIERECRRNLMHTKILRHEALKQKARLAELIGKSVTYRPRRLAVKMLLLNFNHLAACLDQQFLA